MWLGALGRTSGTGVVGAQAARRIPQGRIDAPSYVHLAYRPWGAVRPRPQLGLRIPRNQTASQSVLRDDEL